MTVNDVIALVMQGNKGSYDTSQLARYISDVDERIFNEIITTHEPIPEKAFVRYDNGNGPQDGELLAGRAFVGVYTNYCDAEIYRSNGENDKYNSSIALYNADYKAFRNYYNRTHMPIGTKVQYF